jgi:proteasome lid subunit RPN8/RPN11
MIRVGEVYKEAIKRNAAAIIVAHLHPSGDPTPSLEDVLVTRAIVVRPINWLLRKDRAMPLWQIRGTSLE